VFVKSRSLDFRFSIYALAYKQQHLRLQSTSDW